MSWRVQVVSVAATTWTPTQIGRDSVLRWINSTVASQVAIATQPQGILDSQLFNGYSYTSPELNLFLRAGTYYVYSTTIDFVFLYLEDMTTDVAPS